MDSWEDQADSVEQVEKRIESLSVNAAEFVPGRNIHAAAFVPGGAFVKKPENDVKPLASAVTVIEATLKVPNSEQTETQEASISEPASSTTETSKPQETNVECETEEEEVEKVPAPKESRAEVRKDSINLVVIGHVDAGKSTLGGQILFLTGMIDKRTLEKYEREAREKSRESWYLSWALDTNIEERDKGKTVECGRGFFVTEHKHFTLLDAPGHKSFVPNMISGAAQADLAMLVISARKGEFETGFEKGGQTQEHAVLVKTTGVKHMIVLINKMDDPTVNWDEARYKECKDKLVPFLRKLGFNPKTDLFFMPISGFTGMFVLEPAPESVCPWYRGPTLLSYLDALPSPARSVDGTLRLPIADKFKDMGTFIMGKIESGQVARGQSLVLMPNKMPVEVVQVSIDDDEVDSALAGDNVKLKLKNVEEEDVMPGFVLCTSDNLCTVGSTFDAHLMILDYKSIICAGYTAMLHVHTLVEEVTLQVIIHKVDKKTGEKTEIKPRFIKQDDSAVVRFKVKGGNICIETFKDFPQMGRFTLRDENKTVAIGKVLKVIPAGGVATGTGAQCGVTPGVSAAAEQ